MKNKLNLMDALLAFCVCTTCITLLQGTIGILFFPNEMLDYGAFFAPPIFAVFSVILGLPVISSKELTVRQVLARRGLHLILIEGMVFGLNYIAGTVFAPLVSVVLAIGIAVVFVSVHIILWLVDRNSAAEFNKKLKEFQKAEEKTSAEMI